MPDVEQQQQEQQPELENEVQEIYEDDEENPYQVYEEDKSDLPFEPTEIAVNELGWGPCSLPSQFSDIPYQPFSKGDKVGKVTDWTGNSQNDRRQHSMQNHFGAGGTAFSYVHEEDESSFSIVTDNIVKPTKYKKFVPMNRRNQNQRLTRNQRQQQQLKNLQGKNQQKRKLGNAARTAQNRYSTFQQRREKKKLAPSVPIEESWELLETIEFSRFADLAAQPGEPKDLVMCGQLDHYDRTYDNVRCKQTRPLQQVQTLFHNVTTTEDPIIRELAQKGEGNIFATDLLLATLMTATRSNYSWDIIAIRMGDKLFLDKRDNSSLDYLEVSETAPDAPHEDAELKINTPQSLAVEAAYINHNFSQQVLQKKGPKVEFPQENPFAEDGEDVGSVLYRYRKWDIGGGNTLVARTEIDGAIKTSSGVNYCTIKALNEYKSVVEWKQQLDTQPGAVLAAELKKNTCKLARWTMSALLADTQILKLGYVARQAPKDKSKHMIMGMQTYKPKEFASQIHINVHNCWGILRSLIDICMGQPQGKYLIMKDPNIQQLHVYKIPMDSFEDE